ncbi:MAG: tetratricopeptide repeat protein [Pseudonocardiaceae bacterium]
MFTDAEARQLLSDRGVTDETVVEAILDQSGRLPLDVATLAQARPQDASAVGDPSGSTVERFLKWEPDPQRRMAAQHAALPRRLDQEIFAVATGSPAPSEDFAWLCHLSFVAEHTEGFQYHDIVRTRMLRVLRRGAPGEWQQRHTTLADHYQSLRDALGLSGRDAWRDDRWQNLALEEHYHRLCAHTASALPAAKAGLIDALAWHEASVPRWTQMIEQAGRDTKANTVVTCGERLSQWCAQDTDSQLCILSDLAADTTLDDHHRSIAYDERGVIYEKLDRYEEAVADFTRAIGLNPEYQWAFVNRGKTNLLMDRYEEAVTDFTRAISLGSTFEAVIASRGMAYQAMGRHEEALTDFIRVIELNPASEWAFFNRGMTYFLMDRYGEGLADLILAIKLNPKYQLAIIMRGLAYQEMGRYEEALVDLSLAIRLDPKDWWAIANRGVTYRLMGRYEEALVDLSLAIRLDPKVRWAIANRGVTYRLMGRYEDALADLNQAIDLDPKDELALVTLVNRGVTYRLMGRYEEALESLRLAIVLDESESGWAYYQMALVSLARDCAHDARQQLQRALDVKREQILTSQGDGQRRFDVAVYLMALGARDEAQEQVRESLEQDARIADILEAIRNFKDLQVATGSDVSEILCALRTSLHRLQEDEPPTAPRCH